MAFVAASSYIYINGFGLSAQTYSYYFALNAVGMIIGPMLYMRLSRKYRRRSLIFVCFAMVSAVGLLISLFGGLHPWILTMLLLPATICTTGIRPPGANLMLEQQRENTGSASSLMSCFAIFMGAIGMTIISLKWSNTILVLGMLTLLIGLLCGALWLYISRKPYVTQVPERFIPKESR